MAIWVMLESTGTHHQHTMDTMAYYGFGDGTMTCYGKNLSLLMKVWQMLDNINHPCKNDWQTSSYRLYKVLLG